MWRRRLPYRPGNLTEQAAVRNRIVTIRRYHIGAWECGVGWTLNVLKQIVALVLALAWLAMPAVARAEPVSIDLKAPCVLATDASTTAQSLFARKDQFNCDDRYAYEEGKANWALFDGLALRPAVDDPLRFRHAFGRERSEQVFIQYADGAVRASPTSQQAARQIFSSGDEIFDLPRRHQAITAVLVRVEGLHAVRGVAPRPGIDSASTRTRVSANFHMFYGLFGGIIGAMLVFNLTMFLVIKQRFQLHYCLFSLSILAFAFGWSGGVFLVFPDWSTFDQVRFNNFAISACLITAPAFFLSFLEPDMLPKRHISFQRCISFFPLAITLVRSINIDFSWLLFDRLFYGAMLISVITMAALAIIAMRKGSRAVRLLMIGWSLTFAFVFVRGLWALNIVTLSSSLFDLGLFVVLGFEVLVSALGIGWRIRGLRRERDEARGREEMLTILAETDSLTGLLNRRAFLARAMGREGERTLLLIDIDRFKLINDRKGHDHGDQVLCAVAEALRQIAPHDASVGRLGGEEFAIACGPGAGETLGQQVRAAVSLTASSKGERVTVSVGVAQGALETERDWRALYIAADVALFQSKRGGRDKVTVAKTLLAA